MKISKQLQTQIFEFCRKQKIDLFIIFGSWVKNDLKENSDIDIAVLSKTTLHKLKLIVELEVVFQKEVDVVIVNSNTDPLLRYEIFFSGQPLFEEKIGLFEEEKLKSWKFYIDTKKIRELRDQSVKEYIRNLRSDISGTQ